MPLVSYHDCVTECNLILKTLAMLPWGEKFCNEFLPADAMQIPRTGERKLGDNSAEDLTVS